MADISWIFAQAQEIHAFFVSIFYLIVTLLLTIGVVTEYFKFPLGGTPQFPVLVGRVLVASILLVAYPDISNSIASVADALAAKIGSFNDVDRVLAAAGETLKNHSWSWTSLADSLLWLVTYLAYFLLYVTVFFFDAAIIYGSSPGPDVHAVPLFDEHLTPVCTPELLQKHPLASPDDLARHTLLHPTRDHADWKLWLSRAGTTGVDANAGPTFQSLDLATSAATQGFGVAMGDRTLVAEDVAANRLVMPFDLVVETGARYYFVYPDCVARQLKVTLFSKWIEACRWDQPAVS